MLPSPITDHPFCNVLLLERDRRVVVTAPTREDLARVGPLPHDLQQIAVGIVEIDALLVPVIPRVKYLDARGPECTVGFLQVASVSTANAVCLTPRLTTFPSPAFGVPPRSGCLLWNRSSVLP